MRLNLVHRFLPMFLLWTGALALFSVSHGCIVRELPTNGLPCGKRGECSTGLRCYVVGDQGNLCLLDSKGFEPFQPGSETRSNEPGPEPAAEPTPELVPDSGPPEEKNLPEETTAEKSGEETTSDASVETVPENKEPVDAGPDSTGTDGKNTKETSKD